MKLRKIAESILKEIGDSSQVPPGAKFTVNRYEGLVNFNFTDLEYTIELRIPVYQYPEDYPNLKYTKIVIVIDFYTNMQDEYDLTDKHQAIKLMSYIVGCVEEWIKRYRKKFVEEDAVEIAYLKYNPKSNDDETWTSEQKNKRDRLYRMYLDKFAKRYNSSISFDDSNGIVATFTPPLIIQ